jgi:CubicO group peptidase (beta-lactamase class C family)
MLLAHTAGTSDFRYSGYRYGYYQNPPRPIDQIPTIREELRGLPPANTPAIEVIRKPGVFWRYSPAGYTVVQAALMAIYDTDFAPTMSRLILEPLGMRDSTFAQPVPNELISRMAVPYLPDGTRLSDGPRVFNTSAAGGLMTTATDLAKFVIAVQEALRGRTQGYVMPRIARQMMVRQAGTIEPPSDCFPTGEPSKTACQSSWGLGFDVSVNRYLEHQPDGAPTGNYFAHTGFNSGYLALILGSKSDGNGLVVLLNMAPENMSGSVPQFSFLAELTRRVADEERWM